MPILKSLFPSKSASYESLKSHLLPESQTEHLDDDDDGEKAYEDTSAVSAKSHRIQIIFVLLAAFLLSCCSLTVGFVVGIKSSSTAAPKTLGMLKFGVYDNETYYKAKPEYGGPPSHSSNLAWSKTFPPDGGFFYDEELAPVGAALSVYHQLHCIDAFRHSYWTAHHAIVSRNTSFSFADLPNRHKPAHVTHCLDYIRQMLMCNADLTLEHVDAERRGRTHFGGAHTCVDWDEIFDWTVQRQQIWFNQHGPSPTLANGSVEEI